MRSTFNTQESNEFEARPQREVRDECFWCDSIFNFLPFFATPRTGTRQPHISEQEQRQRNGNSASETARTAAPAKRNDQRRSIFGRCSVSEAKEEQNTVVSNSKGSLIPPSCFFEGEDPITNHNTVATCTSIWYGKRPV